LPSRRFKGAWRAIAALRGEAVGAAPRRNHRKRRVSTRIEGARARQSRGRAAAVIFVRIHWRPATSRRWRLCRGEDTVFAHWDAIPLTENHLKQLHRDLLGSFLQGWRHRGAYKTCPVTSKPFDEDGKSLGVVFATAAPFDAPRLMSELVSWVQQSEQSRVVHPLLVIAIFVVVLLEIHPFQDGNGRLSRT